MKKLAVTAAVAITVAAAFEASAFADSRNRNETRGDNRGGYGERDRSYRDNERVTSEGRISSMSRERDGYRVQLDRGRHSYWVPERYARRYSNDWRIGLGVRLGGIFRNGAIYVDVVNDYPNGGYYGDDRYGRDGYGQSSVRGVVERVDYRRGLAVIRDDYSRRHVTVEMRSRGRNRGNVGLDDIRRGDYVEISGSWDRGGVFEGYRVESVRQGRW